ncbi:hypothetical protein [Flavobacterium selenitireducens]|uniref:hypothetical protein n=1 Tax=Flavobacterium selenitireducens TaxID=2722704 RepID=UPI00168B4DE9|nr:hypothetical protein [Flavobacterium selenitireducens]MBD3582244.1 hypothetical protein [Flavobacterium selenitireducens]
MKKKLEAELISLAHRILQLKNKQDIAVLQEEARKLYEKLSVLRFVDENFAEARPTIGQAEVEEKLEQSFDYDKKVVIGEIPSEEELEEEPGAEKVSELVGNLAASKSVSDEPFESEKNPDENADEKAGNASEMEAEVPSGEELEVAPEAETSEASHERTSDETPQAGSEESDETVESPTLEEGKEFVQPEVSEEIKFAEEANRASEMFWDKSESGSQTVAAEDINTEVPANSSQDDVFLPKFELSFDDKSDEKPSEDTPAPTFTFDDLLGKDYADPVFVKPEELEKSIETQKLLDAQDPASDANSEVIPITRSFDKSNVIPLNKDERGVTLNDKLSKGITIGLNDRIAFMKQLFNNSSEDYNRVLSQLITFDNYTDAKDFIDTMVKPDYDNWAGKEEYEQRFLEIVEKRFQ